MNTPTERSVAADILTEVTAKGAYNSIALRNGLNNNAQMPAHARAFVTNIVNGVLRNLLFIDYVIGVYSSTPVSRMKPFILNVLRSGVFQIIFMDKTPDSAAVNESVKLVKKRGFKNLAPFVNGVLRAAARNKQALPMPDKERDREKYLSVKYSCPLWLIEYWLESMSFEAAEAMCAANNTPPRVTVRVNTLKTDCSALIEALTAEGVKAERSSFTENALFLSGTADMTALSAYKDGLFHVMDEGAMAAAAALNPRPGDTVMDVCAAPGGKSFLAAYMMENRGRVLSFDVNPRRLELLKDGAKRLGISIINASAADALVYDPSLDGSADALLIDAPCSGLGLLRKKPDIRYTKTMEDISALSEVQRAMLTACAPRVKPGGVLVYAVCTVSQRETYEIARWFSKNSNFLPEKIEHSPPYMLQSNTATPWCVQLTPGAYEGDGFFIAKFRKAKE